MRFVASLPCCTTGASDVQAAHIRRRTDGGTGMKPSDCYVVPLSVSQHALQHRVGELKFWYTYGGYEKAIVLAKSLYDNTGDGIECMRLIAEFRNAFRDM